ncbi:hypothetical protein [Microbacterium sp. CIAB417]|uniref:hypothetical protein n=1 Tax=Microbacterium sp. CIAB417 TaxID=2860287 RepID=UPI001FAC8068|nr:hypothetical protein [Microbacterium sp. CIAB417]
MSDEDDAGVEILRGGAIAVDTEALRDVAVRLGPIAAGVSAAADAARQAHRWIVQTTGLSAGVDTAELWAVADRLAALRTRIDEVASGTGLMADVYELVELRAEHDALLLTDAAAADAVQMRIEDLEATDERLATMADALAVQWEQARFEGLDSQFDLATTVTGANFGAITAIAAALGTSARFGVLPPGSTLKGTADPVRVAPVQTSQPVAPPASLADAMRRFPQSEGAQVRVETYTFADGSKQYAAYIKGTQSGLYGAGEPWDMKSNTELYTGRVSASYQATLDALRQAGAEPGDVVDVYGYSQGGMVAANLAMSDEFEVRTTVLAGSPNVPALDADQTLIRLSHTDDVVNSLAGGGWPAGTGSDDSLVIRREGDPGFSVKDLILEPHMIENYVETAELADASGDVRLEAYRDRLRVLADAVSIESTEYAADRTGREP